MMSQNFDVAVIGAGPGGYIAAIRAAQLGLTVACIEQWKSPEGKPVLGGTCLNVGCIPSKALLASSEEFESMQHHASHHGITVKGLDIDIAKTLARKNNIVNKMTQGIEFLFRKNKITWLKGQGSFSGKTENSYLINVKSDDKSEQISAKHVIIATGSKARHLPQIPVDNTIVCDNEGALNFSQVPKTLGIIGAGVIGLELGSVWRRLGAKVTILEAGPQFLAAADTSIAKEAHKLLTQQGLNIELGIQLGEVKTKKNGVTVNYTNAQGQTATLDCDRLIVSVGRVPNTENLGLDTIGLTANQRGFIDVDNQCRTLLPNIYAIGDVTRGPMLAHKAEDEGVMVAEVIAGQKPHIDYACIPWVIYTAPEIAWVGQTEQALKEQGHAYKVGQFPFAANGRALGIGSPEGFVKILADAKTDQILGVHIIGLNASDLIAEAVLAMEFKAASEDIARICHAHPSLSEVMREAALACDKRTLNM